MSKNKIEMFATGAVFGRIEVVVRTADDLKDVFNEGSPFDENVKATSLRQLEIIEQAATEFLSVFAPAINKWLAEEDKEN